MAKSKVKERLVVDDQTGEVLEHTTDVSCETWIEPEPAYVKCYIEAWVAFKAVHGVNTKLICQLLPYINFANDQQRIILAPDIKREIAAKLGWSEKTALTRFSSEMGKLCRAGVLKAGGSGIWHANPELFGRGSWPDIRELRATFHVIGEGAGKVDVETVLKGEED